MLFVKFCNLSQFSHLHNNFHAEWNKTNKQSRQWLWTFCTGLHKIIVFRYLMFVFIECSVKVHTFFSSDLQQKRKTFFSIVTETSFCVLSVFLFLFQKHFSLTGFCFWQNMHLFGFLCTNSQGKFLWEVGVSVISDNRDNNFVEPWLAHMY